MLLSVALQSAMLAFNTAPANFPADRLQRPAEADLFRRLNNRHRKHLVVSALMQGISVVSTGTDLLREAQMKVGSTVNLTLVLDTQPASLTDWQKQINQLFAQKWNRDDRLTEIVLQQTDLLSFIGQAVPITADSQPWLMVLMDAVLEVAFRVATDMKDVFRMPRPNVLAHELAPPLRTPSHSAFPSGHATEAFAAAAVLGALYPKSFLLLRQMANRIALNRGYAGVHYPVDHHAGAILGDLLGAHIVDRMFGADIHISPATVPPTFSAPAPTAQLGVSVEDFALKSLILRNVSYRPTPAEAANAATTRGITGILPWLAEKVLTDVGTDAP